MHPNLVAMPYHIDYSLLPIEDYKLRLISSELVPSRRLIKDNIDLVFSNLKQLGLENTGQLLYQVKNKNRLAALALESGIDEAYLTILGRELRSTIPRAEKWLAFKEIDHEIKEKLIATGIKNTKQYWEKSLTPDTREILAEELVIKREIVDKLARLSDLCRVRWVNHTFAEILWKANVRSVEQLCAADYKKLHSMVVDLNNIYKWYNAHIGKNDFNLIIAAARDLSIEMKF